MLRCFRVELVSYQQLTGSHLVSVSRSLVYTASLSDHNNSISCRGEKLLVGGGVG